MRKLALLLLAGLAVPAFANSVSQLSRPVTAEQLEQILVTAHGKHDRDLESQLSGLFLSQRLSAERLTQLEAGLPGPASRKALMGICDEAGFLDLPARDLPANAPPDKTAQNSLLTLIVNYVNQTTHALPNFFATRETTRFETALMQAAIPEKAITHKPLSFVEVSNTTVFYRDGRELQQSSNGKYLKVDPSDYKLETKGEFGSFLAIVLSDALHGKVTWGHWEQGPSGLVAVFRYSVAKESSHFSVFSPDSKKARQEFPAYHGEIAANPADGSILRITVLADFDPSDQNIKADLLIEYGSVEIGQRNYICPLKSVALSVVRIPVHTSEANFGLFVKEADPAESNSFRMRVNDTRFTRYHVFRAETRLITGDDAAAEGPPTVPSSDDVPATKPTKAPQP
jgi:hypothetical protein